MRLVVRRVGLENTMSRDPARVSPRSANRSNLSPWDPSVGSQASASTSSPARNSAVRPRKVSSDEAQPIRIEPPLLYRLASQVSCGSPFFGRRMSLRRSLLSRKAGSR